MSDNGNIPVTYYLLAQNVERSGLHGHDAYDNKFNGMAYRLLAIRADRPPQIAWWLDDQIRAAVEDRRNSDGNTDALWSWGLNAIVGRSASCAEKVARGAIEKLRDAGHTHVSFGGWVG